MVGDFNGDAALDLALAGISPTTFVSVLLGNGEGSFQVARTFSVGNIPVSLAVGDLNGDGWLDLVVANSLFGNGSVSVLLGNGDGSFQPARNFPAGSSAVSLSLGDFNGDGWLDVVVSNVGVFLGNGDGTLQPPRSFAGAGNFVVVGDFDGDGRLDLALAHYSSNYVSVLLGIGDGSFQLPRNFGVRSGPVSVAVGDFNGDGRLDLAVGNQNSNSVSVLINNSGL